MRPWSALATVAAISAIAMAASPAGATVGKISLTPDPATISRGESVTISVALNEPMICIEADPCQLVLDLSDDLPTGFTFDPAIVTIDATAWYTVVPVTATLDADAPSIEGNEFTVSPTAVSGSEYYDLYQPAITFTVIDPDEPTQAPDELAATGTPDAYAPLAGLALGAIAVAVAVSRRSRRS